MKKILTVVGARPNFMKAAPLHKAFQEYRSSVEHMIVHTGQHYDEAMSKVFFDELELPEPDFYLGVGSGTHAEQTAKIMVEFEKVVAKQKPRLAIVVGDVNSTVACSLVCAKMGIPVAHVEAGLRSFDRTMPEEINRLLTDAISEYLFVTEPIAVENLLREGIDEEKIFLVGNIMIDSISRYGEKAGRSGILKKLDLKPHRFVLVTLHRPGNVDEKGNAAKILTMFEKIGNEAPIIFPIHPRTRKMLDEFGLAARARSIKNLKLLDPLGYLDFLCLMNQAQLVLTDSGGIQEETTYLGIPCLTLRENTERPITVEIGTNQLCGLDVDLIVRRCHEIIGGKTKAGKIPDLWDGKTAGRIASIIHERLNSI